MAADFFRGPEASGTRSRHPGMSHDARPRCRRARSARRFRGGAARREGLREIGEHVRADPFERLAFERGQRAAELAREDSEAVVRRGEGAEVAEETPEPELLDQLVGQEERKPVGERVPRAEVAGLLASGPPELDEVERRAVGGRETVSHRADRLPPLAPERTLPEPLECPAGDPVRHPFAEPLF